MANAGKKSITLFLDALLIKSQKGNKPWCLQNKDGGNGDGTADAEWLQAGQDLEESWITTRIVSTMHHLDMSHIYGPAHCLVPHKPFIAQTFGLLNNIINIHQ